MPTTSELACSTATKTLARPSRIGRRRQFLAVVLFSSPRTAKAHLAFNVRVASSIGVQEAAQTFAHIVVFAAIGISFSLMRNVYMYNIIVRC